MREVFGLALLTGVLVACSPTRSLLVGAPEPSPQIMTQDCNGARVQLTVERKHDRTSAYTVSAIDLSGAPLTDVTRVVLTFTSMNQNLSTITMATRPTPNGHYISTGTVMLTPGAWIVEAIVRRTNAVEAVCVFSLQL